MLRFGLMLCALGAVSLTACGDDNPQPAGGGDDADAMVNPDVAADVPMDATTDEGMMDPDDGGTVNPTDTPSDPGMVDDSDGGMQADADGMMAADDGAAMDADTSEAGDEGPSDTDDAAETTTEVVDDTTGDPCTDYVGLATASETAMTPRADAEAERIAREVDGTFIATQATYDRVAADIPAIRAAHTETATIAHHPLVDDLVAVIFSSAIDPTTYTDWACMNTRYGAGTPASLPAPPNAWTITFDGIYDWTALAAEYATLADVSIADTQASVGATSDVCASAAADVYTYIFDDRIAAEHIYYGYTVDGAGAITVLGTWDTTAGAEPTWFSDATDCTNHF